ncbi:hypothetical protein BZA77DRAFT_257233 [Pyronema omphalodes]|nr:hypothetical protein BZA77DRAFT_257233 [Pyronema omphalodes]
MLRVISQPPARMYPGSAPSPQVHLPPPQSQQLQQQYTRPAALSAHSISQIYKNCRGLFLTRRLPEALASLLPVIHDPSFSVRTCSKSLKIKIFSLYLAILDAAAKTGANEGKATWGQKEWPELVGKIRSGQVWDEVNRAYGGEGKVDAEVVVSLATLLLSHAPDQRATQKRIEDWMGNCPSAIDEDVKSVMQRQMIAEIYILHVLPRTGEWEYAREFTMMSPDIDVEIKEHFYTTLDRLQKDQQAMELQSRELERQREEELEIERIKAQETRKAKGSRAPSTSSRAASRRRGSSVKPTERSSPAPGLTADVKRPATASASAVKEIKKQVQAPRTQKGHSSLITTTTALLSRMQQYMTRSSGPFSMLQTIIMLMVIAWMTNNKRMRDKVRRWLVLCWIKIARTVGMGMKVTYV